MRVTAWALLPLAAFLTGALQALWTVGTTVAGFVTGLVFNPGVWAGVALAGLSVVLFVVSGVIRGRKLSAGRKNDADPPSERSARPAAGQSPQAPAPGRPAASGPAATRPQPAVNAKQQGKGDDDFADIEELLKRRGIS
ncbi:cellulose synthase [Nonomuraea antimicrobica]